MDQNGTVTAVGVGEATITASVGGKSDTCTVTVSYAGVTSVTLNATELTLTADGTTTLTATVPCNADAEIRLPDGSRHTVGSGTYTYDGMTLVVTIFQNGEEVSHKGSVREEDYAVYISLWDDSNIYYAD